MGQAHTALQGAIKGMQVALMTLREGGLLDETQAMTATFAERQCLVDKPNFDTLGRRYATTQSPAPAQRRTR